MGGGNPELSPAAGTGRRGKCRDLTAPA